MLKVFDSNPVKFYEEFKLGKEREEVNTVSTAIGDIVDFYLLECEGNEDIFVSRFDEKFALFKGNKGTGQVYILADCLYEIIKKDEAHDFNSCFTEAVRRVQADGKYKGKTEEKVLEDFKKNGFEYFKTLTENEGKTVVDQSLVDKALFVANKIKNDAFTDHLFDVMPSGMERLTHLQIVWNYKLIKGNTILCKSEVDMVIIDHDRKLIRPYDLKTTYDNESFDYMYIKNSYYLQNAFYHTALQEWRDTNHPGYTVAPMKFLVGDTSSNNRRPLIYETDLGDIHNGMYGFKMRGQHYRGVSGLIEEIAWCEANDVWDCSRDAWEKKGRLKLNIPYE